MADRTVKVRIDGDASGLAAALASASAKTKALATSLTTAAKSAQWRQVSTGLLAVGATLTAVSLGAVKMASDFEHAMSAVAATGAEAKASIGQLSELALELGAKTKYTSVEAAEGIEALAKAGLSTADIIGGALAGALALAASDNMSLEEAAESTAMTLTQFGLAGSEAAHVADVMAAGAGKAVGSVHDMSEALNNVGTVASQMGISLEETTGTLALFAQNGIVGAEAGTQLKSMLLKLMNPAADARKTMDELGISVYDSNGKFVGLAAVAEQLKTKLGDLTQEQRDQAMATIFGSRAVLGASILYKNGAAGVTEWTDAVNDAGFAEEMAAEKMNNLQGDIEKLKSTFSNLAVSAGSSAQGPLRSMVQTLTQLIGKLNEHPQAVQAVVVAMGLLGVSLTAVGAAMKAVTVISEALDLARWAKGALASTAAVQKLTAAWNSMSTAQKRATIIGAALGATITALGSQLSRSLVQADAIGDAMGHMADGSQDASASLQQVSDAAGKAYLSIGGGGRSGLAQAMNDVANSGFGDKVFGFVGHLLGMKTTADTARENIQALDQSLAKMVQSSSGQASQAFHELGSYIQEAGLNADQAVSMFGSTADALRKQAEAAGVANISNQALAEWMSTGVVPAAVQAGREATNAAQANDKLAESAAAAGLDVEDYASTLTSLAEAMNEVAQAAIDASNAQISVRDAIADANSELDKNGATLDINTEAGRANQSALNDLAEAALKAREAQINHNESLEEINETTKLAREAITDLMQRMGAQPEEIEALIREYGLLDMSMQDYAASTQKASSAVQGTASNFEFMGRQAGIAAEDMNRLRQANEEGAAALDTAAQKALVERDALIAAGASTNDVVTASNRARDAIVEMGVNMGLSREQAGRLADAYGIFSVNLDLSESSIKACTTALGNNAEKAGLSRDRANELAGAHHDGVVALNEYANKARDANQAVKDGNMSAEEAATVQRQARDAFIDTAKQMGYNEDEANKLADAYGLIPGSVTTKVTAPGAVQAKKEADDTNKSVRGIPTDWRTAILTIANLTGYQSVVSALNSLMDKTVTITTVHRSVEYRSVQKMGDAVGRASGGYVTGPGTSTSDSIPAWLSDGEYVIRAAAVRRYGVSLLDAINGMRASADGFHFARGGYVQAPASVVRAAVPRDAVPAQTVIQVSPAVITEGQLDRYLTRAVEQVAARVLTGALGGV